MARPFTPPGTRPRYAPDRVVDVEHIRLDLELDFESRTLSGRATTRFVALAEGARRIELDAVDLEIGSVSEGEVRRAFRADGRRLVVDLGRALTAGERSEITVAYSAAPRRGLYFLGPDADNPARPVQAWTQGQDEDSRHWFPCFDAPHEKATSEVLASVPAGMTALSNGVLVDHREAEGRAHWHWRHDSPHSAYLITLVAGRFAEIVDDIDGVAVRYHVAPGLEDAARRTLGQTPAMIRFFSERLGVPFPYPRYAQVCVADFLFGGMENTTQTTLTDTILLDARAGIDHDREALVAHELAHQWFGDLVTCREWSEGWLNEGFATYAEYLWRERRAGADEAALELADFAREYFEEDKSYRRPMATRLYREPIDLFDHHLYEKGGRVLHMLRRILGDEPFFRAVRHYLEKFSAGLVETRDLARAVEESSGRSLDWFFDQWVQSAGYPELKVTYSWDADAGAARFAVRQAQKVDAQTPLFRLPLEVRFRVGDEDLVRTLEVREESETFLFPLAAAPTQAIFDSGAAVLCKAEIDKPRPLWIAELRGAARAVDRIGAARALARDGGAATVAALAAALEDPFHGTAAAAAASLGEIRSPAARAALVAALVRLRAPSAVESRNPAKRRRAIVRALGDFRHDDDAAAALAEVVGAGDPSLFVEGEACLALGRTRAALAPSLLRRALERPSYQDFVRQMALRGLAAAGDEAGLALLEEWTRPGRSSFARRAAAAALAELAAGRRDRAAATARERLEELLADRDFRVKAGAVESLLVLGDPAAGPALRRAAELDLDGRIRRRAGNVARDLEEGQSAAAALRDLGDVVERLRADLAAVRERVAASAVRPPRKPRPVAKPVPPPPKPRRRQR